MRRQLNCILLVDDDEEDIFYHRLIIERMGIAKSVESAHNGLEALDFLKKEGQIIPELIFLDINMPKMNGWEFLEEYKHLNPNQKARITIVMLTTSANPSDIRKAEELADVHGYRSKPLSNEMLTEILENYFPDYL